MTVPAENKSDAIAIARRVRAEGKVARVMRESGIYTQPGRGVAPFVRYFVVVR